MKRICIHRMQLHFYVEQGGLLRGGCWNPREPRRFFDSEFPFSKTRLRNGCRNGTGGYQQIYPHLVRSWFSKDSSVQVFPPFSSSCSSSSFSRTLFFGCCVCDLVLRSFLFSPPARGAILIVANITTAAERRWRKMRKRPWISYFLFSLKMMTPLATMFVMTKVRVVITRHHHHHPAMILLVCCRLLHLVVPRDRSFFLSFFLTDIFSVFLLLRHIMGNSIASFGRLLTCFSCSFFLILFRYYFCRIRILCNSIAAFGRLLARSSCSFFLILFR